MEPITDIKNKLTEAAKNVQTKAKDAWECAQDETQRAVRLSSLYARQHPLSTALVAVGVGVVIGLLVRRREPETFSDRFISEPLHQSKGLLLGLLVAGSAILKRTLSCASCAARDAKAAVESITK